MGIKYFFSYFRNKFGNRIESIKNKKKSVVDKGVVIDNLLLDMNGIFHNCAQKVYEYGNYKGLQNFFGNNKRANAGNKQKKFFMEVCSYVEMLFDMVEPQKRLILCVDGVAPMSKQSQQRQRRFKAAKERKEDEEEVFDSNSITPGTKLMDYLSKYIDWFIKKKMTEDERWRNLQIIFSNEKNPGEGEHKLINFIKKYGTDEESYMIQGMDADLIMLSLSTRKDKFWILREDHRSVRGDFFLINVENFRGDIMGELIWDISEKGSRHFDTELAIYDFILMCFCVGNDFLPHIPTIEILEGGLETMFDTYKNIGKTYGHLTERRKEGLSICKKPLEILFGTLAQFEEKMLTDKKNNGVVGYEDTLLTKYSTYDEKEGKYSVDFKKYRAGYYRRNFEKANKEYIRDVCHDYLKGINWVLEYYTSGLPSWDWIYPHHYAPFFCDLSVNVYNFVEKVNWGNSKPISPFQQLLCVLPTKSSNLIPEPLFKLLHEDSVISDLYPTDFQIDLEGRRNDWEGVALLPFVDMRRLNDAYYEVIKEVPENEAKRNKLGKCFQYRLVSPYFLKSYNGDIQGCVANTEFFTI